MLNDNNINNIYSIRGNGNRGVGGYFEIPPLAEKFWKIPPPLEILGKIFEKPGKTEKIR